MTSSAVGAVGAVGAAGDGAGPPPATPSGRRAAEEAARLAVLELDPPASLGALLFRRVERTPDRTSYRWPDGAGGWTSQTWAQTAAVVSQVAAGLLRLGLAPGDRVALISTTRVEWCQADLAVVCAGGATTAIYPTSTAEDVAHILTDSGSTIAIVEHPGHLPAVLFPGSPVQRVVLLTGRPDTAGRPDTDTAGRPEAAEDGARVLTLADLTALGQRALRENPDLVREATAAVRPQDLATLIYTSGTTGRPKGVRLTHRNWVYLAHAMQALDLVTEDDLGYLWLPMAHSFGKALLSAQVAVGFAAVVDGDVSRIITNLPQVRPTVMPAVPRIFEKVYAGVNATMQAEGALTARLFDWAVGVGLAVSRRRRGGRQLDPVLRLQHLIADRLVLAKLRDRFGGRMRYFISGSAPLSRELAEWFDAIGLLVLEGYGLTESSAVSFVNRPDTVEFGTVGHPLPGTQVSLAADGEILISGGGVTAGYHELPDATAATLVAGWLHTGDVGELTAGGALKITDRKKDLIKTSGGKYVAPQTIETRFRTLCPLAAQIVVHGEQRNYVTALIALDPDAAAAWAAGHGLAGAPLAEIARSPELVAEIGRHVAELNAGLGKWETIKKFSVLDRELTIDDGDLTPSLKLKRRVVERRHADLLEQMYTP